MSSEEGFPYARVALAAAVVGLAGVFAIAMLGEWWPIAVKHDLAHIGSYRFGSQSMMGHGGWRYANPEVYAWTAFAEAIAAVATMPAIWLTIVRRSRKAALALVLVCVAYLVSSVVLGQMHWSARQGPLSQSTCRCPASSATSLSNRAIAACTGAGVDMSTPASLSDCRG